jgi:regulatory protein
LAGPGRSRGVARNPLDCHERALRLLSARPRSERELRSRLLRAGFEAEEVEAELLRLEAVGLIDDDAFARQAVEHELLVRRSGRRAIASRLGSRGLDRETVERALADLGAEDEETRVIELARSRTSRLAGLPPEKAFPRLVSFLARRGYSPDLARHAARAALAVHHEEAGLG